MRELRVYFEGDPGLRSGFRAFFTRVIGERRMKLSLIAGGPNEGCIKDFESGKRRNPGAKCLLLIDAEGPLGRRRRSGRFHMVQVMESWFLADREALKAYFGRDSREKALPGNRKNVEDIPKADVLKSLDRATEHSSKGRYSRNKVGHAAKILERLDPEKVRAVAPECHRLLAELESSGW